jgi:hypothetical protein
MYGGELTLQQAPADGWRLAAPSVSTSPPKFVEGTLIQVPDTGSISICGSLSGLFVNIDIV